MEPQLSYVISGSNCRKPDGLDNVTDHRLVLGRVAEKDIEAEIVRHGGTRGRFPPSKRSRPALARGMLDRFLITPQSLDSRRENLQTVHVFGYPVSCGE